MSQPALVQAEQQLRVEVVSSREALANLGREWDRLADSLTHASPLSTHTWFTTQIEENANLRRDGIVPWRCFAAYRAERLVGVLPLVEEPWDLARLRGPVVRIPGEYYLRSGEPLLDEGSEAEALAALLTAVRAWRPGRPVEFGGLRDGPGVLSTLRSRAGVRIRQEASGRRIQIAGTADEWCARLGRSHRKNLSRRARRLEEAFPGQVRYRTVTGTSAVGMLEEYARLEMSGWKGDSGVALLASPSKMRFYRRLCVRLAERGWLEWHVLEVGGRPAAIDMWVRIGGTLSGLFSTYDEALAPYSPGALRLNRTIEEAFASADVRVVDVITANAWTDQWRMEPYSYYRALVATGGPLPLLLDDAAQAARRALRPLEATRLLRSLRMPGRGHERAGSKQYVEGAPAKVR